MDNIEAISKVLDSGFEVVAPNGVTALKFGAVWVLKDPYNGDKTFETCSELAIELINDTK